MRTRWNGLQHGVLTILCSLALLLICTGWTPITVRAAETTEVYIGDAAKPLDDGQVNSPYITDGTVTWDSHAHTLTLDNATIAYTDLNATDYKSYAAIDSGGELTIVLEGNNQITTDFCGIYVGGQPYGHLHRGRRIASNQRNEQ